MKEIKNLNAKLDSNTQIISLITKDLEVLNKISRFQIAFKQLNSKQKNLNELNALLSKDISSIVKNKHNRRNKLIERSLPVIKTMQVFAFDKQKKNLQERLEYLTSDYVQNCSDIELIKISKKLWEIANKYGRYSLAYINTSKSALNTDSSKAQIKLVKKYGLTADMIKNLEEATIKFIESVIFYKAEKEEIEKVAKKIKKINKEIEALLNDKIDKYILLIENKNPALYKEYCELRDNKLTEQQDITEEESGSKEILEEKPTTTKPLQKTKTVKSATTA